MPFRRHGPLLAAVVLGPLVLGCGSDSTSVAPTGDSVTVQVLDNSFRPETLEIWSGTEVVFANRGRNDHNILPEVVTDDDELTARLADGGSRIWGVVTAAFGPNTEYRHTFIEPGTYTYYCSIHGTPEAGMYGTLVVADGSEK